ncbi:helix-turn-helix transcriptional regulator [Actinoplanes sp. NPDC049316]|uniref:helix-turn-helix transcriptional regulator n=1 Tax=Actinoplanes sp. NPDC049316 TaxID=3154727 RepID=UPI003444AF1D
MEPPLSSLALVPDAIAGVMLTASGDPEALPRLPGHRLLAAGSPVLTAARTSLAGGAVRTHFLTPRHGDASAGLLRVTVLSRQPAPSIHHQALVLLLPPPDLRGLTHRELQVLGLLIEGENNAAIAGRLHISVRTAAGHVDHILAELHATSRTMAAVSALRQGLYIPAVVATSSGFPSGDAEVSNGSRIGIAR